MPKFLAPATGITPPAADNSTNLATTSYVQGNLAAIPGANYKPTAAAATTGPLPACTYGNGAAGVGATLTGNAFGTLIVDGYTAAPGEAILVKNQSIGTYNGLYTVAQIGDGTSVFILTRHPSMDASSKYVGAVVAVRNAGITNAGTLWYCTNPSPPTVGSSSIGFAPLGAAPPADFVASGPSHAHGLVPDPGATAGAQRFLREDATWQAPPVARVECRGRLTLASGDPIGASGAGSGGTIYFTPFRGNLIGLHDGSAQWNLLAFPETSIAAPAGNGVYDVFAYNNAGTVALETTAWANLTTRATSLATQDGIYVKSGATTRRYLGSFFSTAGTVYDTTTQRHLWNYYNRAQKRMYVRESTNWTYGVSSTWRQVRANPANQLAVVCGVKEDCNPIAASLFGYASDYSYYTANVGYDSVGTQIGETGFRAGGQPGLQGGSLATVNHMTDIGFHTYIWLEYVELSGTTAVNFFAGGPGQDARFPNGLQMQY